jgi:HK97 family phage portal protein
MANFSLTAAITNALIPKAAPGGLQTPSGSGGWWPVIREPFTGAWQRNREIRNETALANYAVFSSFTLISSDVGKCRLKLVEQGENGVWDETSSPSFSPVLIKPNHFQSRIQFYENWIISKLAFGNTYVLLKRDSRNVVVSMYVLDPLRTKPLVAPNGDVYYQVARDNLSGVEEDLFVPASEIIHDRWPVTIHPLVGLAPLNACKLAAQTAENIQNQSLTLFANASTPGGILTAPGNIDQPKAYELKQRWKENQGGLNLGGVAIMGNGLTYVPLAMKAVDAQLVEQLGSAGKIVTTALNVPAYMVGVGDPPAYNNVQALNQQYYSQCLQKLFEAIEELLDEALGLRYVQNHKYGAEFEIDDLLRMDTAPLIESEVKAVRGSVKAPNEARKRLNLKPVEGGDSPLAQHQDYSLAALAKRDAKDDPFAAAASPAAKAPSPANDDIPDDEREAAASLFAWEMKSKLSLELPSVESVAA